MANLPLNNEITFDKMPQALAKVYAQNLLILSQLGELKENFAPKIPTEYLTRNEVAEMLKVDLSTLWLWQKKGKLIPVGLGNRVYYRRSDIDTALIFLGNKKEADNE